MLKMARTSSHSLLYGSVATTLLTLTTAATVDELSTSSSSPLLSPGLNAKSLILHYGHT